MTTATYATINPIYNKSMIATREQQTLPRIQLVFPRDVFAADDNIMPIYNEKNKRRRYLRTTKRVPPIKTRGVP